MLVKHQEFTETEQNKQSSFQITQTNIFRVWNLCVDKDMKPQISLIKLIKFF